MPNDFCWLGPLVGGAVGYFIRAKLSRDQQDRKEDRAKLDKVVGDIEKIEEFAHQYFASAADSEESKNTPLQINRALKRVGNDTYQMAVLLEDTTIPQLQLAFKQKVTLNADYESASRQPKASNDQVYSDISDAARRLIGGLELAFRRKYRRHNKQTLSQQA